MPRLSVRRHRGQKIDGSSVCRLHLPSYEEQVGAVHGGILSERVLETALNIQRRQHQLVRHIVVIRQIAISTAMNPAPWHGKLCHRRVTLAEVGNPVRQTMVGIGVYCVFGPT